MTTINTTVAGIPCIASLTDFVPGQEGITIGPIERCCPHEDPEIYFQILDRRGRPAPWLERKLTDDEGARIANELVEAMEAANEPDYCFED